MLAINLHKAVVKIDLDNPTVGMGQGIIVLQSGSTQIPFPFQVISESAVSFSETELLEATKHALAENDIQLNPVKAYIAG